MKTYYTGVRLSEVQRQKLTHDAEVCGMSKSDYLRSLVDQSEPRAALRFEPRIIQSKNAAQVQEAGGASAK